MTLELKAGMQLMHNGSAVRLLYLIRPDVWRVQPLFVRAGERDEIFGYYDAVSFLHTQGAI